MWLGEQCGVLGDETGGQRLARWRVPDLMRPAGQVKEFGFISKWDGKLFQKFFPVPAQSMDSQAQAPVLSNHPSFLACLVQSWMLNVISFNDFKFWMNVRMIPKGPSSRCLTSKLERRMMSG